MATIWQDIRFGFRMLARKPAFAVLAIITLALGIGGNTAIFSVVNAVLLSPLPFRSPGQLVQLWQTESAPGTFPMTGQDHLDWRAQNRTFEDMAVYSYQESFNASVSGEPERVTGVETQSNYFSLLGVRPALGRLFLPGDPQAWQNHEVLLSNGFWKRHFAGQSNILESSIELNSEPYRIVGVMPAWFRIPATADLWIPIDMTPKSLGGRGWHHLRAIGRIKDGVTIQQARGRPPGYQFGFGEAVSKHQLQDSFHRGAARRAVDWQFSHTGVDYVRRRVPGAFDRMRQRRESAACPCD